MFKVNPKIYSEEEIQKLESKAELDLPIWAVALRGPRNHDFVYFYTDYENDDVKISPDYYWCGDKNVAEKAFEIILIGLTEE